MDSVDVRTQIIIARPLEVVAAFAANPENAPAWYKNIKSVQWETRPGVRLGARVAFVARFLGRRMSYTYEIIEFRPNRILVMRASQGPFPMETSYAWQSIAEGETVMTLRNRGRPAGFAGLFAPFLRAAMRQANNRDLACLKELLEKATRQHRIALH